MLVGYEAERARLTELVEAAMAGRGGALLLRGEAGSGKSTLCEDLAVCAVGCHVLRTRGSDQERAVPFAALDSLVRPLLGRLDTLPGPQADALGAAVAIRSGATGDRLALAAAVLSLLAGAGPILALVDDAQAMDLSSQHVLAFVAARLGEVPVAMVAVEQSDGDQHSSFSGIPVMTLGGLAVDAVTALLARWRQAPDLGVAKLIALETGGNPLAVIELAQTLTNDMLAGLEPLPDPLPVGPRLHEHFGARVHELPASVRAALLIAAAGDTDVVALRAALEAAGCSWEDLEVAEAAGLVTMTGSRFGFRHPLVRAAAYYSAAPAEQRRARRLLAAVDSDPDRRVWHQVAGTVAPDEEVVNQLLDAAGRALARGGYPEAARALQTAGSFTSHRARRLDVRIDAARAWHRGGMPSRAIALLDDAMAGTSDPVGQARLVEARGEVELWLGHPRTTRDLLRAEAQRVQPSDTMLAARLRLAASLSSVMIGELSAARELAQQSWEVLRGTPLAAGGAASLAQAALLVGEYDCGKRYLRQALPRLDEAPLDHQVAGAALLVVNGLCLSERWTDAAALAARWIEHGRRHRGPGMLAAPLGLLAESRYRQGRLHQARADATEALEICNAIGYVTAKAHALALLARVEAALGDDAASAHAQAAMELADGQGPSAVVAYAHHALGLLLLGCQRHDEAIAPLEHCRRRMSTDGVVHPTVVPWAPDLVEAFVRAGRATEAAEVCTELVAQAEALGTAWCRGVALRAQGLLGGHDAGDALEASLALLPVTESPFEAARTELALGELLRRRNHRRDARLRLAAAMEVFTRLGSTPWAERARIELRAAGGRVPSPASTSLGSLTPQELRIALRVAAGETNREVAASLYLSHKTVENTLTSVYAKLGVRSRTELRGLVEVER